MPRVTHVKKARKAIPHAGIEVGDSYYWWKFRQGGKQVSKTPPKRSQLTNSPFLSALYDYQDGLANFTLDQFKTDGVTHFLEQAQCMLEEEEEKCSNMECNSMEHLPSYETISERRDVLQAYVDELETIEGELDLEEPEEPGEEPDEPDAEDFTNGFDDTGYQIAREEWQTEWDEWNERNEAYEEWESTVADKFEEFTALEIGV